MKVHFAAKNSGKFVLSCPHLGERETIAFVKKYSTSDKGEIRTLLSHPFATSRVELVPGQDFKSINEYLESEERPDTMTKDFLRSIPFEAWREIIDVLDMNVKFPLVGIAKAKLEGQPMDERVERIAQEWAKKTDSPEGKEKEKQQKEKIRINIEKAKEKAEQQEAEEQLPEAEVSTDLKAKQAAEIIENAETDEELEGFLSVDEDRVTVLRAWDDRFPVEEETEDNSE